LISSSSDALVADLDGEEVFLFPFSDIYFEFLRPSAARPARSDPTRDWWDVSAVGEGHAHAMWAVNETAQDYGRLQGHGCFDQEAIGIEANPSQRGEDSTRLP